MNSEKKILCVADSLSMPREGVAYEDTWVYMLKKKLPYEVIQRSQRGLTSAHILKQGEFLEYYSPHTVILQVGIVDCAPRYMPANSNWLKIINKLPKPAKSVFWKYFKKYRQRKASYADVTPEQFRKNIEEYCARCLKIGVKEILIIKIAHPGKAMFGRNHGVLEQIVVYNRIFDEVESRNAGRVYCVNPIPTQNDSLFTEDGYHLNNAGSKKVTSDLLDVITRINAAPNV
ncbi:hypothetical protein [Flavobacterium sp.]|uniref:SGNH/GDSL hydrolase family protein n=1 Tax=Flavobacterium sp. TaxID=239 RepID=UPI0026248134|nr:hypothetical protein [Flavobacterium sp.]